VPLDDLPKPFGHTMRLIEPAGAVFVSQFCFADAALGKEEDGMKLAEVPRPDGRRSDMRAQSSMHL